MPTFGSLFAGIGGIDLGLERAGWECRFQVEWDSFCQRVLAKHWPDVPRFGDIHDVHGWRACPSLSDADRRRLESVGSGGLFLAGTPQRDDLDGLGCPGDLPYVDLLAGGFPCQPFSIAGKQRRLDDDRWLWPEFARTIRELRPRYVLVENVPGLLVGGGMDAVLGDLAELGYDTEWESIPAAAVGAPHLRYRVWIVAYANGAGLQGRGVTGTVGRTRRDADDVAAGGGQVANSDGHRLAASADQGGREFDDRAERHAINGGSVSDAASQRQQGPREPIDAIGAAETAIGKTVDAVNGRLSDQWSIEPDVGRVAHGVPARVDRLRSLGNAVVPQVVEFIGRRILEAEAREVA